MTTCIEIEQVAEIQ